MRQYAACQTALTAPKQKNDPKYVAAARELRDRYLEHVNKDPAALPAAGGKYDVNRGQLLADNVNARPAAAALIAA